VLVRFLSVVCLGKIRWQARRPDGRSRCRRGQRRYAARTV